MFESLDEARAARVRPWQAPRLGGATVASVGRALAGGVASTAAPSAAAAVEAATRDASADATGIAGSDAHERLRASAYAEGHAVGYAEGQVAGRAAGHAEGIAAAGGETAAAAAAILAAIARERQALDARLEEEVLALVHTIARLVLRREIEGDGEALGRLVRRALGRLPQTDAAPSVHLHPLDAEMLAAHADTLDDVTLVPDPRLDRGDCRIVAGASSIDAGADAWVDAVIGGADG